MPLLYNGTLIPEEELQLPVSNRAFQFNDGFFETIMVVNGKLRFWDDHQERMLEAALALKLELMEGFRDGALEQKLLQLAVASDAVRYGRLKLKVWRGGAGLYTPQTNAVEWLATIQPYKALPSEPLKIGICQHIQTLYSPLSHFKGPNAPIYVMAGLEKQEQDFEDMLLLDRQQNVSELISSNIFWIKEGVLYTPALDTGCVNGIARRNILRYCQAAGIEWREVRLGKIKPQQAEAVFAANVTGIRAISLLNGKPLIHQHPLIPQLQKELFQG